MSERLNDYFATEASEYLDQLERLLARPGRPDVDQLLRLSTGVRGSAQMAGADTVAQVAERLEDAARSIVSSNISWSEEIRQLSRHTVDDLQLLVRALNRWGEEEERRVRDAVMRWEDLDSDGAGDSPAPIVSITSLFYDDGGPHILVEGDATVAAAVGSAAVSAGRRRAAADSLTEKTGRTVSIETLLFRGDDALREALRLRGDLDQAIGMIGDAGTITDLVDQIYDLIEQALNRDSRGG